MSDNTEDFKELINEKFKSVHAIIDLQFSGIKSTLESIDAQVKKTNGRVTKLEDNVYNLQMNDAMQTINCPQHLTRMKDIEDEVELFKAKISTELEEYNFFRKYPKIAIGTIAIVVVILLLGYSEVRTLLTESNKPKIENVVNSKNDADDDTKLIKENAKKLDILLNKEK